MLHHSNADRVQNSNKMIPVIYVFSTESYRYAITVCKKERSNTNSEELIKSNWLKNELKRCRFATLPACTVLPVSVCNKDKK